MSIATDIRPLLKEKSEGQEIGGYFAIPILILTLVEYLGRLRYGYIKEKPGKRDKRKWSGSSCAVWWMKKYLGSKNPRYKKLSGLLYDMFRHGAVHRRQPKIYLYNLYKGFGWEIQKAKNKDLHLQVKSGKWFELSLDQLVDDLELGIDKFYSDLESSDVLRKKFSNAYEHMKKPQWVPYLKYKKKYLVKDFEFLSPEIKGWK